MAHPEHLLVNQPNYYAQVTWESGSGLPITLDVSNYWIDTHQPPVPEPITLGPSSPESPEQPNFQVIARDFMSKFCFQGLLSGRCPNCTGP